MYLGNDYSPDIHTDIIMASKAIAIQLRLYMSRWMTYTISMHKHINIKTYIQAKMENVELVHVSNITHFCVWFVTL